MRRLLVGLGIVALFGSNAASCALGNMRGAALGRRGLEGESDAPVQVCVDVEDNGPVVPVTGAGSDDKPPPAQGGTMRDGRYHMTGFTLYGAPKGYRMGTSSSTLEIHGDHIEAVAHTKILFSSDLTFGGGKFQVNGNTLDLDLPCPPPAHPVSHDFTVSGDDLVLYSNERSGDVKYLAVVTYRRES